MKMMNLVPKFTKSIKVADIKQYLVNEFEKTNTQQREIEKLKDGVKKAVEIELKYNTTLVTLDEYKKRLDERERRISKLEDDIGYLEKKLKKENELKNDEILKYKKLGENYNKLKKNFDDTLEERTKSIKGALAKEYHLKEKRIIENKINIIKETKGALSKAKVISILER